MDICWNIELLGGLRLRRGDQLITHFRTQNTAALLAHLAYYPHQRHRRDVLIDMLWPESGPASGRHSLSLALSALRRQLEAEGTSGMELEAG
jgi:DNA-binding SARP family transcriptional activator